MSIKKTKASYWKQSGTNLSPISNTTDVGIGTDSPATRLHVSKTNATSIIRLERDQAAISSSDILGRLEVETTDTTDPGICAAIEAISFGTSCETGLRFKTGTPSALVETVQIDPDGRVGIGTPWPDSADAPLHVQHPTDPYFRITRKDTTPVADDIIGRIEFETQDSDASGVSAYLQAIAEGAAGEVGLALGTGTGAVSEQVRIDKDGNVGIGTGSPTAQLHLVSGANNSPKVLIETTLAGANSGIIDFYHNTVSPADADILGRMRFTGYDSAIALKTYGQIQVNTADVTAGDHAGKMIFQLCQNGSVIRDYITINGYKDGVVGMSEIVMNDHGVDCDFRVESDVDANTLFLEGSSGNLGVGAGSSPLARLHMTGGAFLADGTTGATPTSGAGTRMMWIPDKAAFRAGTVTANDWDSGAIGQYSFAAGLDTQVLGLAATALGIGGNASGTAAFLNGAVVGDSLLSSSGLGSFASGVALVIDGTGSAQIWSAASGTLAAGISGTTTTGDALVVANQDGATALGAALAAGADSTLSSSGAGSIALGYAVNGTIGSSGFGSLAHGICQSGSILASADGAFSQGSVSITRTITASGVGSLAHGHTGAGSITATAQNALAIGDDINSTAILALSLGTGFTNATASSFKVGFSSTPTLQVINGKIGVNVLPSTEAFEVNGSLFLTTDSQKIKLGTGKDMTIYYDGTDGHIDLDDVSASDLIISCGTDKTLELTETVWDDYVTPLGANNWRGTSNNPTLTKLFDDGDSSQGVYAYVFADGDEALITVQLPHRWKEGTDIHPHIHFMCMTDVSPAENFGIEFEYTWADIGEDFPANSTLETNQWSTGENTQNMHQLTDIYSSPPSGAGHTVSSILVCRIKRVAADADNYAGGIAILDFDIHYEVDTMGSRQETVK